MVLISGVIQAGKIVYRFRKQIYRTLVAQDRAIDRAFKIGGYGRQTRYGARHGALAGSVAGAFIDQQGLPQDSGIPQKQRTKTNNFDKKRGRNFRYNSRSYEYGNRKHYCRCRKPATRRY